MAVNIEGRLLKPVVNDGSISHGPLISQLSSYYPKDSLVYLGEYGPYSEFYLVGYDALRLQNNYTGDEFNVAPRKLIKNHDNCYKVVPIDESDVFDKYTMRFIDRLDNHNNMTHVYYVDNDIDKVIARFKASFDYKTAFKYAGYILDDDGEEK